ncbi:MAG: hypothetical protein ALECFALPRED_007229 [Alectoria fallacina]|uniref:Uncharacterized protein n=1 Tax=Alectoria fallacina TaxID=1903189 RepID=A0A8H3EYT9_9LECA|nr:MAG: hypothetical protein ALECFALPRED_007229 [Alectoria fallacina]
MPPFPALLANASSPNFHIPHASQPTVISLSNFNQSQWGPDSIGTIVFGFAMFFMGVVALWQGRARRLGCEQDEEHGRRARVGGRPVDVADEFAMVDLAGEVGSERAAVGMDEGSREDEGFVKIERGMRTDTEGTLVGRDEDEGEVKGLEE